MKKLLVAALLLSFMFCFLEWPDNSMFVFQIEWDLFFGDHDKKDSFTHPVIALPFIGQILLLIALFQKQPGNKLIIAGILPMGMLGIFLLFIGILGMNLKIILSTLPFFLFSVLYVIKGRKIT